MPEWLQLLAAGLVGLLFGSFANVLIARVPHGQDWVRGSSRCLSCEKDLAWFDNIPLASWLVLRGRCRQCGAAIGWQYPAVEAIVGLLFVLVMYQFGLTPMGVGLALTAVTTIALAAIDFRHMRLPTPLVYLTLGVTALAVLADAAVSGEWAALTRAAIGAAVLGGTYFVLWFVYPRGLGFGDVRLAVPLGLLLGYLGWGALAVGAIAAPVLGLVWSVGAMIKARSVVGVKVPFGPWMIAGFWIAVFWGETMASGYVSWVTGW